MNAFVSTASALQRAAVLVSLGLASIASSLATAAALDPDKAATATNPDSARIVIEAQGLNPPAPVFFSAAADGTVRIAATEISGDWKLRIQILQGKPETLSLGLNGDGEIASVSGPGLRDWSVRQSLENGVERRYLDLRLANPAPLVTYLAPKEISLVVHTRLAKPTIPGSLPLLLFAPGDAVGFASTVTLDGEPSLEFRVASISGYVAVGETPVGRAPRSFSTTTGGKIEVSLSPRGAAYAALEIRDAQLTGRYNEAARSAEFRLRGQLRAQKVGARLPLLAGHAALNEKTAGDGWHIELVSDDERTAYELVADREGVWPIDLGIAASVIEEGDWRRLNFFLPAAAVVPLRIEGLAETAEFDPQAPVVPSASAQGWQGFLPADGAVALGWKSTRKAADGALAFTSNELAEIRVAAGLLRQESTVSFRVMQGKLSGLRLLLDGPGEILGVFGANVLGWNVIPGSSPSDRVLEVRLSRPLEGEASLIVRSQAALDGFPVRAQPLRLTPEGAVRHSGFVRIANQGAVRLEVADAEGMMQLAPAQFPGAPVEGARQIFVYRFPSANYGYRIVASQIQAEVGVSEIVTYELTETDRIINADLELDIREAPLRDWSMKIPADYVVVALSGAEVADHTTESGATSGQRVLKILFSRAVEGRQLLSLRLEKNQPASVGDWSLPALEFPGAKSVRGHLGAVATPGYRMTPASNANLVEIPLSFFPRQTAGLQQAWRVREPNWSVAVHVESLGQSVQADVFHLYSLREGAVYGSVLFNYFVVGSPANEWRIEVPESAGNIDVIGQNVRHDWRREGNQIVVSLHQPVLGAATLLVTFEQPLGARGGTIEPGAFRAVGVQSERGYIQVVSPLQVKHQLRRAEGGLLKLEPLELPVEYRLLTSSPSLAVYQYTARPFALEIGIDAYAQEEMVDQVVDFAKLASQLSREGQVVTDARYFVKTRGSKSLRLTLPPGMKLWEARVDQTIVTARADGGQTVLPLPARLNPNEPVEVALRLGQPSRGDGRMIELAAPKMTAPIVIDEWTLRTDPDRQLVPRGGTAQLPRPALTETGMEWIARHLFSSAIVIGFLILGTLLLRGSGLVRRAVGLAACIGAIAFALLLAAEALANRRPNLSELSYAATILPAGDAVVIQVASLPHWRAGIVWPAAIAAVLGLILCAVGGLRRQPLVAAFGAAMIGAGLLFQHLGAPLFFGVLAAVIGIGLVVPGAWRLIRDWRLRLYDVGGTSAGPAPVVSMLALVCTLGLGFGASRTEAAEKPTVLPYVAAENRAAQSIVQSWSIREKRLFAEIEWTGRGIAGDAFILLKTPAVLTDFKSEGAHVSKVEIEGTEHYRVILDREGLISARARFELAVPTLDQISLLTGPAAIQRVTIDLDQSGWEFASAAAVNVTPSTALAPNHSGATLTLAPAVESAIQLRPQQRNTAAEASQFFAEVANLYLPGPGVVNGRARVTVRPAQGRVSSIELDIPRGYTVGEVSEGPVGTWRFDPEKRRLRVAIEPAQTSTFRFNVDLQIGTAALPVDLAVEPVRVIGAAGEVGLIALAFGSDAQPEAVRAGNLSAVNLDDVDASLIPRSPDGQPLGVIQHVWRYGREGGRVELKVAPVAPEVRVTSHQLFTLDDDRLVGAVELAVAITRVGLFKLSFVLPSGLEIEALSGPALNHWTESAEAEGRVITLHLNGRTLGEQRFNLSLAGPAPHAQPSWSVPRLRIREATRQTGELLIVPGKGIRLRAAERDNATPLDPRSVGGQQPGTLAFRLLQEDWSLGIGIEALDAWVTAQALQEVTLREGQTLTRIGVKYRIDNAALRTLRVRLPGLSEDQVRTLRATGSAVSDFVKVSGEADTWEIRFQRGIAGETEVQIEFQGSVADNVDRGLVTTPVFVGARQTTQFVAVRSAGRLELDVADLPRGWQRIDWSGVPAALQSPSDRSVPAFAFRVSEPERPLAVAIRHNDLADALKLRVTSGELTTLFSPTGASLTAVELKVDVTEKSTLRVRLPARARLFNTFVNGESVAVVRDGDACLFYVSANSAAERFAQVRFVYGLSEQKDIALEGPGLSVPLENVSWRVALPPGYKLDDYAGGLRLREDRAAGSFGLDQYLSSVSSWHSVEAQRASALFKEASALAQRGEQQRASEALSRAAKNNALDQASNEDARVQLKELKTQQAVLGLTTRRQRMYLDNRGDGPRNEQLEQAVTLNPFLQGKVNFNAEQVGQSLMGNSVEENTALRGIANRIVEQQLAAEPAPSAIDVTLPERGRVLTFTRSLQVDGNAPLRLTLEISQLYRTSAWKMVAIMAALAVSAVFAFQQKRWGGTAGPAA